MTDLSVFHPPAVSPIYGDINGTSEAMLVPVHSPARRNGPDSAFLPIVGPPNSPRCFAALAGGPCVLAVDGNGTPALLRGVRISGQRSLGVGETEIWFQVALGLRLFQKCSVPCAGEASVHGLARSGDTDPQLIDSIARSRFNPAVCASLHAAAVGRLPYFSSRCVSVAGWRNIPWFQPRDSLISSPTAPYLC